MSSRLLPLLLKGALLIFFGACLSVVLFFANGYSFDFVSQIIRKTGLIQIEYNDSEAVVSLDNVELKGRLPFVISGVLPGRHLLEIEKQGYEKWVKEIEVREDLISRVEGVFLIPIDQREYIQLLIEADQDSYKVLFVDDYLVLINSEQIKYARVARDLNWAGIKSYNLKFKAKDITQIKSYDRFVKFQLVDGSISLFDLDKGEWFDQEIQSGFIYSGDNWYYVKGNLFAVYDESLSRIIQANILDKNYFDLSHKKIDSKDWYLLKNTEISGDLYLSDSGEMDLIEENVLSFKFGASNSVYFLNKNNELWAYSLLSKQKRLLARIPGEFKLIGNNLEINRNDFGWIYSQDSKFWIADQDWGNSKILVDDLELTDVIFKNPGQIYLLTRDVIEGKAVNRIYLLDLEN